MKTLLIHPNDPTTAFLEKSYSDKDFTLVNDYKISKSKLKQLIKSHDKIIMMGHGTPDGLISDKGFLIDSSYVYLLKDKICICIWCHADKFFYKYKLKGYATGMVISELDEGYYLGVNCTYNDIKESNDLLTNGIKLALGSDDFQTTLLESYDGDSDVIFFNKGNL